MNLITSAKYNGYPVITRQGPLIEDILISFEELLDMMRKAYKRITVMNLVLKFPKGYQGDCHNISAFFDALRFRVHVDIKKKMQRKGRYISSHFGYAWAKELSHSHGWHYHVVLFFNHDVYNCFGKINSNNMNMYNRITGAWASAMKIQPELTEGLVHIVKNPIYKLDYNSESIAEDIFAVLYRLSYLAKLDTKPYKEGRNLRFFGTSRRRP